MSERLTLAQCELLADAALGLCRRHRGRDHTTGTHSARDVTRSVTALVDRGLLEAGEEIGDGWRWRPTGRGERAARRALGRPGVAGGARPPRTRDREGGGVKPGIWIRAGTPVEERYPCMCRGRRCSRYCPCQGRTDAAEGCCGQPAEEKNNDASAD